MIDAEPSGTAQWSSCYADGATSTKKKSNKIPQESMNAIKRGMTSVSNTATRSGPISRRNAAAGGYRRQRQLHWNAVVLPQIMAKLGSDMREQLDLCSPSEEDKVRVERCFEELQATVAQLGTRWRLEIFGSVASGFSTSSSDMDATCVQGPTDEGDCEDQKPDAMAILFERLAPVIRTVPKFSVVEEIPSAKVPILRLRFEDRLDIDLSCENTAALRNTRLLRAYAQLDDRVRDLGVAVKLWAKAADVCGAAQSRLSSYTFTLLVIYFMQVHREVNLPCMSPGLYEDDARPESAEEHLATASSEWARSCLLPLPDLFYRFIDFYARDFDWGREVVCPRLGQRRHSTDNVFKALRGRHVGRIHVEDPYTLERNLHCVLGESQEGELREAFGSTWHGLFRGVSPVGLRPLGQKMELQLSESLLPRSPMSSPDFGPAPSPNVDSGEVFDTFLGPCPGTAAKQKVHTTEPPGVFSSAGSTESGADGEPPQPLDPSSGESRCSDDEAASGSGSRFHTLEELEHQMVHKQDIAAIARGPTGITLYDKVGNSNYYNPSLGAEDFPAQLGQILRTTPTEKNKPMPHDPSVELAAGQWWLNLGSAQVMEAVQSQEDESKKKSSVITVADLERQMAHASSEDSHMSSSHGAASISPLYGRSFAASASSRIASRIANKCFGQVPSAVKVA